MTSLVLGGADPATYLSHAALYGLAAILEDHKAPDLALSWTSGMAPRPQISCGWDPVTIATTVHRHAQARTDPDGWMLRDLPGAPARGLMSPRIAMVKAQDSWEGLQHARHVALDQLVDSHAHLDLRLLAALGEPAYWRFNPKGDRLQDDGASRLDMTPRNQGSELVGTRLRKLATAVAARAPQQVHDGLTGASIEDEAGKNSQTSRTANGMAPIGPVDNALAWCAQWGISQMPLTLRIGGTAHTAGHLGPAGAGHVFAPTWRTPWRPARLRTILASRQLADTAQGAINAASGATDGGHPDDAADLTGVNAAAPEWLNTRGVLAVYTFPIHRYGSASAPERRIQRGQLVRLTHR